MASFAQPRRSFGADLSRLFARLDGWLALAAALLTLIGLLSLLSIDAASSQKLVAHTDFFRRQLMRLFIGLIPFSVFLLIRPSWWRRHARWLYLVNLALLILVLVAGSTRNEAQRWLEVGPLDFQPSELAKLLVVLTLASFFANRLDEIKSFKTFALSFLHVAVPMVLIYKQPHLGSTLVVLVSWLAVAWIAGVRMRFVLGAIGGATIALTAACLIPGVLSPYQLDRIYGFLHPDKKGSGYQVHRGLVAIGSGGLGGKGFMKGEQKSLRFIPFQQTDFVFTVIGEEGGLMGGAIVLFLFGVLFFRLWMIIHQALDPFHRMIAAGILAILGFHVAANLGMVLQMLPVVGLWLPFMSYGGTAMWLCMACVGLALNIRSREDAPEF